MSSERVAELRLPNPAAVAEMARALASQLRVGDVIALDGPMGAGKTTFVRALVEALGGDPAQVSSPTYTLQHHYAARIAVIHVDACRLAHAEQLEGLGFAEAAAAGIGVVEWAERVGEALPERRWRIRLDHDGVGGRLATVHDSAGQSWHPGPDIVRLSADAGSDPLVTSWLAEHAPRSALRLLAGRWMLAGALLTPLTAWAWQAWQGAPTVTGTGLRGWAMAWFGDPVAMIVGAAVAGLTCSWWAARRPFPAGQEPLLGAGLALVAWLLLWDPLIGFGIVTSVIAVVFLVALAYRGVAVVLGGRPGWSIAGPVPEPAGGWPVVTVLVPLYREVEVVPDLAASLRGLDYPVECLDIQILCEADDEPTIAALAKADLPRGTRVLVVPPAHPRTKPRACNHGLAHARGRYLVIFDAEDRPDPDQIRQAVGVFAVVPPQVVCLQAHLAWYNAGENLLTQLFALEYNMWFRRYLPGLVRLGAPIPLGGTSNHFRIEPLRAVGGWDPFNVTEDCDLGVRLHLAGYRTAVLDRTTWEEAVVTLPAWIRQRTRWLKGYLATWAVWGRRPVATGWRLGARGLLGFFLAVPAVPLLAAVGLVLWLVLGVYGILVAIDCWHGHGLVEVLTTRDWAGVRWSWPLWYSGAGEDAVLAPASQWMAVVSGLLLLGNLVLMALAMMWGRRPDQPGIARAGWLMPWYWLCQGIAAWRAVVHAVLIPHRWEKTVHHRRPSSPT